MYDFANSGYTTVVLTAVFNAYFVAVVAANAEWATFAWTAALSVSYAMVMVIGPLLGAWADAHAAKKTVRSEERRVGKECRSLCDWSSDVCSSDLDVRVDGGALGLVRDGDGDRAAPRRVGRCARGEEDGEIGRASCRERV